MAVRSLPSLVADVPLEGKRVFVRADLNVPQRDGEISDDTRIRASLPTLRALLECGARVVLASHLGRPKGEVRPELSLRPVAVRLSELLASPVDFCAHTVGAEAEAAVSALAPGHLLLLENLRFAPGETKNDEAFARGLAALADVYVNDAFGTAHRAHASTAGIAAYVPVRAAGLLMNRELEQLARVLDPARPFLCILGGAKVSDKLPVLEALAPLADGLTVGGAMAYTFLAARGEPVGRSLVEPEQFDAARRVEAAAKAAGRELLLPVDHVVVAEIDEAAERRIVRTIPDDGIAVDIGPETAALYAERAAAARTIFWNGPMGIFEMAAFAAGTEAVAKGVAESAGHSIVGGGDSVAAINGLGLGEQIDHLSTGGGASLEYVQGLTLPGVAALDESPGSAETND